LALAALGPAACDETGTDVEEVAAAAAAAEERLFEAMNRDDFGAAGDIVGEMYELRDLDPTNYRNTFMLGAANFWWIAEAGRPDPVINPIMIISQAVPNVLQSFADVVQNATDLNQAGASARLGAFLSDTGFDRRGGAALVDSAAIYAPQIGLFQKMSIRRMAAASDTTTAQAIEWGFKWWEWCAGGPIDRNNPDFTGRVKPPTDGPTGFCWGSPRVPHGYEGSWMFFGDLLVKGGKLQAARRAYLNAQLGPNYNRWKFKAELEGRLASNLTARYATYASHDPANWAPIGVPIYSCTQCHASAR
jgi:hypothetical protein